MSLLSRIHGDYVHRRRVHKLTALLANVLPPGGRVLDVGCGDGLFARRLAEQRPDLSLRGIDVLVRENPHIPVEQFNGREIPSESDSYDIVLFVDVLHHVEDPTVLLREAARVAAHAVVIKDHTSDGFLARPTLCFMDWIGNARHGVALPYNYWPREKWLKTFKSLGLTVAEWQTDLGLYAGPANWVFGRSLHFVAVVRPSSAQA